jgi:hypothetical protein
LMDVLKKNSFWQKPSKKNTTPQSRIRSSFAS